MPGVVQRGRICMMHGRKCSASIGARDGGFEVVFEAQRDKRILAVPVKEADTPHPVGMFRRDSTLTRHAILVHPHLIGECISREDPFIIPEIVQTEVTGRFHAPILHEIGDTRIEKIADFNEHSRRRKHRMEGAVRKPPPSHDRNDWAPDDLHVRACIPVGHTEFLETIRCQIVMRPVDVRRFAVAFAAREQFQPMPSPVT